MGKHLVLVGGGHAHMVTLEHIGVFVEKGFHVTVIGPSHYHYYSGMGPGMLGGTYHPNDIRFATKYVVEKLGGVFIKDKVVRIDPYKKEIYGMTGEAVSYDVLSFNTGSYVPKDSNHEESDTIYFVKPIEKLMEAANKLKILFAQKKIVVSIVGGGPSSAEIAGHVWQLAKKINTHMPDIRIYAGKKFMARLPDALRSRVLNYLQERDILIIETGYVKNVTSDKIILESGESFSTDFSFIALGVTPSTIFEESGLPVGPDKGLLVNKFLQSTKYSDIFGGGDCIYFQDKPLDKAGVYAVRQNPVLLHNLMATLEGKELLEFHPGPDYLLIFNVGGGIGILKKWWFVSGGKTAFLLKDYIDRKFMKKFQALEKEL